MSVRLSPIVSEFETEEQAVSHDRWFREKVASSLAKPGPGTPHDEVMARMDAVIEEAECKQRARA
ncbi:MAG: stability determinant [Pseudomonadota bacterium]|nr:stability determinant [Pseudomonadota bacterium]